jgi:hypothetical protein
MSCMDISPPLQCYYEIRNGYLTWIQGIKVCLLGRPVLVYTRKELKKTGKEADIIQREGLPDQQSGTCSWHESKTWHVLEMV